MEDDILSLPPPAADARLPYGPESLQFGDLRLPSGSAPYPVAVVVHGGFWRARHSLEHIGHLCAALARAGIATWNLEYRRVGNGGGWPATFHDVARGADHLRSLAPGHHLDLDRVATVGHSAGGHLALWLAARHRIPVGAELHDDAPLEIHGAVSLAGVTDLEQGWAWGLGDGIVEVFLGGSPSQVPERYAIGSPAALLPFGVPQTLVHGTEDDTVPYVMSETYQAKGLERDDDVDLTTLAGAGHFEVIDPRSDEWPQVLQEIQKRLFD